MSENENVPSWVKQLQDQQNDLARQISELKNNKTPPPATPPKEEKKEQKPTKEDINDLVKNYFKH